QGELRQASQAQLEDVLGLDVVEVEDLLQTLPRGFGVVGGADDLDDLVDVQDGQQEAAHQVQALVAASQPIAAAPRDDLDPVLQVHPQQLLESEGARLPFDEGDVVDRERVLERRVAEQLLQDGGRI